MIIRAATAEDLDGIVEVFWACWTRSYRAFAAPEQLACLDHEAAVALWQGALHRPGESLVAERDGSIVGVTRFHATPDLVAVHSLYVHPDAQGDGIGGRLLGTALGDAPRGQLWVFSANQQGRAFYAKHGWRPDGVTRVQPQFGMAETRLVREGPLRLGDVAQRLVTPEICVVPDETPPACVVLGRGGDVAAAGMRSPAGDPATAATWFDLASVTKAVTTVALMVLVAARRVDLDVPAGRYWAPGGDLVIADLLQHRSGLPAWQPLYGPWRNGPATRTEALELALSLPRGPGSYWYSDLGFMVLGEVVAEVYGGTLPEAIRRLVCDPLGIDVRYAADLDSDAEVATSAWDDRVEERMVATGEPYPIVVEPRFDHWRRHPVTGEPNDGNAQHALGGVSGHAGLFGRVPDLLRLGHELAAPTVLDPATVARFVEDGPHPGQAFGFRITRLPDGRPLLFHPGFTGCALAFVPGGESYAVGSNRLLTAAAPIPTTRLLDALVAAPIPEKHP